MGVNLGVFVGGRCVGVVVDLGVLVSGRRVGVAVGLGVFIGGRCVGVVVGTGNRVFHNDDPNVSIHSPNIMTVARPIPTGLSQQPGKERRAGSGGLAACVEIEECV